MFFPTLGLIATTKIVTIDIHASIQEGLEKMRQYNHRSIVVVNENVYHVLTAKEMIRLKLEGIDFGTPLSKIKLRALPVIDKSSNIINALNLTDDENEHICVCNEDGTLYGLVTNSDIIASVDPQVILDSLQISTIFEKKYGYKDFTPDTPMSTIMEYMQNAPSDCVIIQEGKLPSGIITSKDILLLIGSSRIGESRAGDVMSSPVDTLGYRATIGDGLAYLKTKPFKRIVVTNDEGEVMGIVSQQDLISRTYLKWSKLMQDHFRQFEEITQILQQRNRHLAEIATKDALTEIHNRHMFIELFAKEIANVRRYGSNLSLMIIDLDHFKRVNDQYGHNIGDSLLKEFARMVKGTIRESDLFARWGGEEFVLLLHNVDCDLAYEVGEKIRKIFERHAFPSVGCVTCSIGITEVNAADTLESAIERADSALYSAKESGRNKTATCEDHRM